MNTIAPRAQGFANPGAEDICAVLAQVGTAAVVGLSPNPNRPSHRIASALQRSGFRIVPVRPLVHEVRGEKAYARLEDLRGPVDLVDVFRSAEHIDAVVDSCIRRGMKRLWIQQGIVNDAAAAQSVAHGIWTVMDRCIWTDLNVLCGRARRVG